MKTTGRQILYFTKAVFFLLIFILQTVLLSAQDTNSKQKGLYLGFNAGTFVYQGDLTPSPIGSLKTMQPGFTVSLTNDITDRISLRYMLTIATLKGEDIKYQSKDYFRSQRRFSFKNDFAEFAFGEKFYLHRTTNPYRKLNPYITAGIGGMLSLNAVRNSSHTNFSYFAADNLQSKVVSDSVHGVPRFVLVVPVGAGLDIRLNDHIFLNVEGLYRFSSSDYLDGFSLSGNNRRNDYYYGISTGIHFLIQKPHHKKENETGKVTELPLEKKTVPAAEPVRSSKDSVSTTFIDSDRDGIADSIDQCPYVKGTITNYGCPDFSVNRKEEKPAVIEKTGVPKTDTTINFTVYFDYDQSSLNGNAFKILSDIIALCRKDTSLKILFKGHTDLSGTVESNYRLSLDRANVCAEYLESYLVDKKRIKTEAYSKLQPAVTTNDERLQWMNRRVEVLLYH